MRVPLAVVIATVGAVPFAGLSAQEAHIKRSDLPAAVGKTVDSVSRGATVRGYSRETEGGVLEYEVEMSIKGRSRDVSVGADGAILEVEEQVTLDSLPAAVQQGLRQLAGKGRITKVESLMKHGALVAYEAQVRTGAKRSEVQVGPDGRQLAHEE